LKAQQASSDGDAFAPDWQKGPEGPLLDRGSERTRIDDVLERVRHGLSGTLVLRGSPGAGKTRLLDYAIGAASGFCISATGGVYSEINLPYSAVHQLLFPFLPLIDDLPAPQLRALRVAFGLEAGAPPERFLVGLACMTLLSRAAADGPVLCAVDDAQWIDAESALALGFWARRLYADRVGVVLTIDDTGQVPAFEQLPTIDVSGLPDDAAAELLHLVTGAPLAPAVVDRVAADTEGNPLALVEIGSHFTPAELAARAYLPEPIPVGQQLAERFLQQVRQLPVDAQEFVLLVAADAAGDRSQVRQAAAVAGIDSDAAETAAQAAELIKVSGDTVGFWHPLIRRAVYHHASDAGKRRAHHLLSEASGSRGDADGRVWHAAAAAAEPDENLAADLQAAAGRSRDRGASSVAAALLRRSAALTPDQVVRARREVEVASAELVIGLPETARQIAADALPWLPDSGGRGEANVVIGDALFAEGRDTEAADALAQAAVALAADPASAADALMAALNAASWAGQDKIRKIAAIAAPSPASTPRVADLLLAGYQARFTEGYDAAGEPLRAAVNALRADDLDPVAGLRWFLPGTVAAGSLWDEEAMLDLTGRWVQVTRRLGALTAVPVALAFRAIADCLTGRLDLAADGWAEMRELIAASQTAGMLGIDSGAEGLLLAYRGQFAQAREAGLAQIRQSTGRGQSPPASMGRSIVALAELLDGHFEAAVDTASTVIGEDPVFIAEMTLPSLIEAAVRSDHQDVARAAFATLAGRAETAATPWALGLRARCHALIVENGHAEEAHLEAISQLRRSRAALDLARAHLVYGQWLRRSRRRRDARRQLRTAEDMFQAMGAAAFAQQAGDELRATGERARKRTPDTESDLTTQEARVASLAASGAANIQIAEQLFISPSTVDYHLGKVFRKLGVRSRIQLARQLSGRS
jgi:DNA-binding CsgD family transcriptional regulator